MLGKLLKYDGKSLGKTILPMYGVGLVLALLAMLMQLLVRKWPNSLPLRYLHMFSFLSLVIGGIVLLSGVVITIMLYYRNNLLKDEGYLMNTLPVHPQQLVASKLLTAILYMLVSLGVVWFYFGMGQLNMKWFQPVVPYGVFLSAKESRIIMILLLIGFLIGISTMLCQIFMSLSVGYRFNGINRDGASILIYIVQYLLCQVLSGIALIGTVLSEVGLLSEPGWGLEIDLTNFLVEKGTCFSFTIRLLTVSTVLELLIMVICYGIAVNSINKHLNLE